MSSAERLRWVVEALELASDEHLFELGGGDGAAGALVLERLRTGTLTGIDRSPLQTERAERRNAEAGTAELEAEVRPRLRGGRARALFERDGRRLAVGVTAERATAAT